MRMILKLLLTALAVVILAYILPGVAVASYWSAVWVAIALGLIRVIIKPIMVILTLPITIVTLGLFLLVINAAVVLLADYFVSGFDVSGFWYALLFSLLLSVLESVFFKMLEKEN